MMPFVQFSSTIRRTLWLTATRSLEGHIRLPGVGWMIPRRVLARVVLVPLMMAAASVSLLADGSPMEFIKEQLSKDPHEFIRQFKTDPHDPDWVVWMFIGPLLFAFIMSPFVLFATVAWPRIRLHLPWGRYGVLRTMLKFAHRNMLRDYYSAARGAEVRRAVEDSYTIMKILRQRHGVPLGRSLKVLEAIYTFVPANIFNSYSYCFYFPSHKHLAVIRDKVEKARTIQVPRNFDPQNGPQVADFFRQLDWIAYPGQTCKDLSIYSSDLNLNTPDAITEFNVKRVVPDLTKPPVKKWFWQHTGTPAWIGLTVTTVAGSQPEWLGLSLVSATMSIGWIGAGIYGYFRRGPDNEKRQRRPVPERLFDVAA